MEYGIRAFELANGKVPFEEWLDGLRNSITKAQILAAVSKMSVGNFGGAKSIKGVPALFEYRIDVGPGYRIYYRLSGRMVVLLWGGTKRTQTRDIARARTFTRLLDKEKT